VISVLVCLQTVAAYFLIFWPQFFKIAYNHRLNGSSSHVLMATAFLSESQKFDSPHRIKTPDLIEIKFGTVDYVS